jgi:uncharacterized membrane protein YedE/YeeE
MHHLLQTRPPWYAVGPIYGLVVVGVLATINQQVGVLGGFSSVVERATGRAERLTWKAWFLFGVMAGGTLYALLAGSWGTTGYGWVSRAFSGSAWLGGVLLIGAGTLIGFGAKTAGGCTSGNGLAGCSFGLRSSIYATMTFFSVAVGTTFILRWLGAS